MHSKILSRKLLARPIRFRVRRSLPALLSRCLASSRLRGRRIYCLSPGEAWFHQFLIDRFSPRLAPRRRWIRATSRSDPPPSLWIRIKFSARMLLPGRLSSSSPSFLRPSVPLALLTVWLFKTVESFRVGNLINDMKTRILSQRNMPLRTFILSK